MNKIDRAGGHRSIRCAIYTRKSSEEGLEQDFNSLDAQREACEAYILSQKHSGWELTPGIYDDGGFSGGTMERPALQELLKNIKAGKIHVIVVYKVDRLTRSLSDFAKIVEILDAHNASFVSVTQQFNTTTSMGRLTLNVLLSFAQFEREIAGERIRDKIAASKRKGMWMGGSIPLGYDVKERRLIVNEDEAENVRLIFKRYAALGSVMLLREDLRNRGIVSKRRTDKSGGSSGGRDFSRGALYLLLQNRIYRGEIGQKGSYYPGLHGAIIDEDLWAQVQERLKTNKKERRLRSSAQKPSLLVGLIVDATGQRMTPSHAIKKGRRYRYYISNSLITGRSDSSAKAQRVPAGDIEALVLDKLYGFLASKSEVGNALGPLNLNAPSLERHLTAATKLSDRRADISSIEMRTLVQTLISRVIVEEEKIKIEIDRNILSDVLTGRVEFPDRREAKFQGANCIMLKIDAQLRRAGVGMRLVIDGQLEGKANPALVRLLRESFAIREQLLSGSDDSLEAMTRRLRTTRGYLNSLLRLSWLALDIIRAILDGQHPVDLNATRLLAFARDLPHNWAGQRELLRIAR